MIKIKHSSFNDVELSFPINWKMNPFNNKSWLLNFMSLRWLRGFPENIVLDILQDFYHFHYKLKKKNLYLNSIRGDHAASIRISYLSNISRSDHVGLSEIAKVLLENDLINAIRPEMYRSGHNHGLMLDISVLDVFLNNNDNYALNHSDTEIVATRGVSTSSKMYFENGVTREHSISYQEYNLPMVIEFHRLISQLEWNDSSIDTLDNIKFTSLIVLSMFLDSNSNYFAVGDSLRAVKNQLLERVYGVKDPLKLICKNLTNVYFCSNGFFSYKNKIGNNQVHFVSTCQWNSFNHKQDDEFSFCLEYKGIMIFDELGYSAFFGNENSDLIYSSKGHSTFFVENDEWCERKEVISHSRINEYNASNEGFDLHMIHERSNLKYTFERKFEMFNKCLKITDIINDKQKVESFPNVVVHRFILNPNISFQISNMEVNLYSNGILICILEVLSSCKGEWKVERLPYSNIKNSFITDTFSLDFVGNDIKSSTDFLITLV